MISNRLKLLFLLGTLVLWSFSHQGIATEQCVVATVNPLASDAGADAFRNGGNAVDAAIAAAVTLGVVDGHNSGLGGGCFILIRSPDGTLSAIDGREPFRPPGQWCTWSIGSLRDGTSEVWK